ncbi:MAG: DUF4199 domain-containing protein [Bacteroidales bacterium]
MKNLFVKYHSAMHGNYSKKSLHYGILMGIVMIVVLLIRYLMSYKPSSPITLFDNIVLLILMALSVYRYRSILSDKKITFKEAWLLAFYAGGIASILFGVFMYLYSNYIDTEMGLRCANLLKRMPEYSSYTKEQFEQMTKPSYIAIQSIIYNIIMAVLWAFIIGIIFRNEMATKIIKKEK